MIFKDEDMVVVGPFIVVVDNVWHTVVSKMEIDVDIYSDVFYGVEIIGLVN